MKEFRSAGGCLEGCEGLFLGGIEIDNGELWSGGGRSGLGAAVFSNAGGENEVGDGGEWGKVVVTEPKERFEEVMGEGDVVEETGDGFGGEVGLVGGGFSDNANGGIAAERDFDDVAGGESG